MAGTDAVVPVVTFSELKAHLRLEDEREDALLAGWLRTATERVEQELGLVLVARDVEEVLPLTDGRVVLHWAPVAGLLTVERSAEGGWAPVLETAVSRLDQILVPDEPMEDGTLLRVRYRAGIAATRNDVPGGIREAVVRLAAFWYANRDAADAPAVPATVRQMLAPFRSLRLR